MAIPKNIRQQVYDKYNGHCAYCGREIAYSDMQVDHIHPKYRGGNDELENLNPACRMCNFRKGTLDVDEFRNQILQQAARACDTFQARMSIVYGLIERIEKPVRFYYEKLKNE